MIQIPLFPFYLIISNSSFLTHTVEQYFSRISDNNRLIPFSVTLLSPVPYCSLLSLVPFVPVSLLFPFRHKAVPPQVYKTLGPLSKTLSLT